MPASLAIHRALAAILLIAHVDAPNADASSSEMMACTLSTCPMPALIIVITRSDGKPAAFVVGLQFDGRSIRCSADQSSDRLARNCGDVARVIVVDGRESIGIFATPATVKVTLIEENKVVATREFVPDYEISYPNGIQCAPQCKNWSADWVVR
jgi:hypothetical protein